MYTAHKTVYPFQVQEFSKSLPAGSCQALVSAFPLSIPLWFLVVPPVALESRTPLSSPPAKVPGTKP